MIYVLVFLHFISTDRLQYYQIGTRSEQPTIIERGKKFAGYDKHGKLLILGYDKRIVQEYADAQSKVRFERQRKN